MARGEIRQKVHRVASGEWSGVGVLPFCAVEALCRSDFESFTTALNFTAHCASDTQMWAALRGHKADSAVVLPQVLQEACSAASCRTQSCLQSVPGEQEAPCFKALKAHFGLGESHFHSKESRGTPQASCGLGRCGSQWIHLSLFLSTAHPKSAVEIINKQKWCGPTPCFC